MMAVLITTNLLFHQLSVPEDVHKYKLYLKLIITRILKERAATGSMAWWRGTGVLEDAEIAGYGGMKMEVMVMIDPFSTPADTATLHQRWLGWPQG
jgi:hypothetical protein